MPKWIALMAFVLPWITASCSGEDAVTTAQKEAIIGIWALAETGCGTDYGAAYTAGGRYSQGDAVSGVEGQWVIENGELVLQSELQFSADDDDWFAEPAVEEKNETQRFSIIKLNANELTLRDIHKKHYYYVSCLDGNYTFLDGEVVNKDTQPRKFSAAVMAHSNNEGHYETHNAFDLICTDQMKSQFRMRFDLNKRKWCSEFCHSVWNIDNISDSIIKVSLINIDGSDRRIINMNRYTSEFWIERVGYGKAPAFWGQCKVEGFSGFPQRNF